MNCTLKIINYKKTTQFGKTVLPSFSKVIVIYNHRTMGIEFIYVCEWEFCVTINNYFSNNHVVINPTTSVFCGKFIEKKQGTPFGAEGIQMLIR